MKIAIITCGRNGTASRCLPALAAQENLEITGVFLAKGGGGNKRRYLIRRIKKIAKIGLLGAWNGVKMRKWYVSEPQPEDIEELCNRLSIPFKVINGLNSQEMKDALAGANADLGLSLGNGFISPTVFTIPKYGMINLHSEILPAYQNAQSIIWPIYCNDPYTGFTIHEIERKIDAGRILYQKKYPLTFFPTLEETVRENKKRVGRDIPQAMAEVCSNFLSYREQAQTQDNPGHYTTPSIWQYWRMCRNNKKFFKAQGGVK